MNLPNDPSNTPVYVRGMQHSRSGCDYIDMYLYKYIYIYIYIY